MTAGTASESTKTPIVHFLFIVTPHDVIAGIAAVVAAMPMPNASAILLLFRWRSGAELHRFSGDHPLLLRTCCDHPIADFQRLRIELLLALPDVRLRIHHHH